MLMLEALSWLILFCYMIVISFIIFSPIGRATSGLVHMYVYIYIGLTYITRSVAKASPHLSLPLLRTCMDG